MKYVLIAIGILILVVIIAVARSPKAKGWRGEKAVAQILGKTIDGQQYVINGLLFYDKSGNSRQIDHIYINKYGIWVIETKNYAGQIYGNEDQREWLQVLANGNTKNKFYNPIKQNKTHIYCLSEYLHAKHIFHNVVCFLDRADISNVAAPNVYSVGRLSAIKNCRTDVSLSVGQMEDYYNRLLKLNDHNITQREHVKNIHDMQFKVEHGICPRCGAKLVLRDGKYGRFYGCKNYPDCTFTKDID